MKQPTIGSQVHGGFAVSAFVFCSYPGNRYPAVWRAVRRHRRDQGLGDELARPFPPRFNKILNRS
jgi:hypothetical protein